MAKHGEGMSTAMPSRSNPPIRRGAHPVPQGLFRSADREDLKDRKSALSPTTYGRTQGLEVEPNTRYALRRRLHHDGGVIERGGRQLERFDKVRVHGTIMSIALHHADQAQYILAPVRRAVSAPRCRQTWAAMPLPAGATI